MIFLLFTGEVFDDNSILRTSKFLTRCIELVKPPYVFWACYQTNCFADKLHASTIDINHGIEELKQNLAKQGVHLGHFSLNMRNSKEIVQTNAKETSSFFEYGGPQKNEVDNSIKAIPSTLVGSIPTLIPINQDLLSTKLKQAIKHILEDLAQKTNNGSVIILHDDFSISEEILLEVKKVTERDIIAYPCSEDQATSVEQLRHFLRNNDNILITHEKYFRGCEASNIIFISKSDEHVRSTITRCIDNLYVVQVQGNPMGGGFANKDFEFVGFKTAKPNYKLNPFYNFIEKIYEWSLPIF